MLSKHTGVLIFVLLPVIFCGLLPAWEPATLGTRRRASLLFGMALAIAILLLHAAFLFDETFATLGSFSFASSGLQKLQGALPAAFPAVFPRQYVQELDNQLSEGGYVAYLLGRLNTEGFWNYYLVAFLVKTPAALLVLSMFAVVLGGKPTRRELPLLLVGIACPVFLSFLGHKNIGIRYILFVYPILAIWSARIATRASRSLRVRGAVYACLIALTVSALWSWPNYLSYFSEIIGGARNGHKYLLDSNLDWGQDLTTLKEYMAREGLAQVDLAYFGRVPPEIYGIKYRTLNPHEPGTTVAISANLLWGRTYFVNGSGFWPSDPDFYARFRGYQPTAILGDTIYIFKSVTNP